MVFPKIPGRNPQTRKEKEMSAKVKRHIATGYFKDGKCKHCDSQASVYWMDDPDLHFCRRHAKAFALGILADVAELECNSLGAAIQLNRFDDFLQDIDRYLTNQMLYRQTQILEGHLGIEGDPS